MKTLKKTLCLVLAVVMVVGVLILPAYAKDSYIAATKKLNDYGVLQGYPDGLLHEDRSITRGQMAAIIYRVMTGDTGSLDAEVAVKYGSYADKFTDADVAPWAKGYIGFCASKGVLKGYDTGAVQPNKKISGYEVMAMLLRALGYDHNGEYTGLDWKYNVLSDAAKTGVNAGVTEISPDAETPRGAVAQYTFNAATKTKMVAATINPVGYKSLEKALIEEGTATVEYDDFGAPETKTPILFNWPDTPVKNTHTDGGKPIKQWWTPVVECDVATAADIDENTLYTTYTNGKDNKGTVTINPTDERSTIGDYGRETSLYKGGIIVFKDIVLAKIDKVIPEITDNAGHTIKEAGYEVTVYAGDTSNGFTVKATLEDEDAVFAKGDMIRAYSLTDTGSVRRTSDIVLYDAVKISDTQVTVDSIIEDTWKNPGGFKGTDGTTYIYSLTYGYNGGNSGGRLVKLQDANIDTTWGVYTDGHNNVIGLKAADTVKGYGVITDIDAERIAFGKYVAKLSVLTSGNKTVTINLLNYTDDYFSSEDDVARFLDGYLGQLIQYVENTSADVSGYNRIEDIGWTQRQSKDHEIKAGEVEGIQNCPRLNDNTVFFIERYTVSASKGGYTSNGYEVIKGFKNIGDLSHNIADRVDGERVWLEASFIDTNNDNWADYVLITGATIVKEDKKEEVDNYALLVDPEKMVETHDTYRLYKAIIDGAESTLSLTFNASQSVTGTGLYTYADRNTNNGAYGDVADSGNYVDVNRVNLAKAYKAGTLEVGVGYYRAVLDDAKVYFVNPVTGMSKESKYDLETVLSEYDGFHIAGICYQTNEYGFIDLVYVISGADPDSEAPTVTYATIGVTSYETGANKGWVVVGNTDGKATDAQKLAAVYSYLTTKFKGYTVTVAQKDGTATAKATLTSNGVTTEYNWKINLDGKVITYGENKEAIGAIGTQNPVYVGYILVDSGKVAKADISKTSAVVTNSAGATWIWKAGDLKVDGGPRFLQNQSWNVTIGNANGPAVLPATTGTVTLSNVNTPIDANGNNVAFNGTVTSTVSNIGKIMNNVTVGKNGHIQAYETAANTYITVNGDVNVTFVRTGTTVTVEKGGSLSAGYIEKGATVKAADLSRVNVGYQEAPVEYTGATITKISNIARGTLFKMSGDKINIPYGAASIASRDEYLVKLNLEAGWYNVNMRSVDDDGKLVAEYHEGFNVQYDSDVIYMFCPASLNDGTEDTSNSHFYKFVPDGDDVFVPQGEGMVPGTYYVSIYNEFDEYVYGFEFTVE